MRRVVLRRANARVSREGHAELSLGCFCSTNPRHRSIRRPPAMSAKKFARSPTARQVSVLWTSHNMYEVETVCDRVLFLSHGRILLEGNPKTLPQEHGKSTLEELFIAVAREPLSARVLTAVHITPILAIVFGSYTCFAAVRRECCRWSSGSPSTSSSGAS